LYILRQHDCHAINPVPLRSLLIGQHNFVILTQIAKAPKERVPMSRESNVPVDTG
jgi:hypothetical protein